MRRPPAVHHLLPAAHPRLPEQMPQRLHRDADVTRRQVQEARVGVRPKQALAILEQLLLVVRFRLTLNAFATDGFGLRPQRNPNLKTQLALVVLATL